MGGDNRMNRTKEAPNALQIEMIERIAGQLPILLMGCRYSTYTAFKLNVAF